jgi:hypothetical protein
MDATVVHFRAVPWTLAVLLILFAGCATTPRIDWTSRIGVYTGDQAVLDMGPPDKQAKLADGTTVAEWLLRRGHEQVYATAGYGYPYWNYGPFYPTYIDSYSPDYFLRLIFGPDGKLKAWKKFAR